MPQAPPGAVIWDMDGTMVDTAELHFAAWLELCRQLGRDFTRAEFAATFGRRNAEILDHLFGPVYDETEKVELGTRKEELYRSAARKGVELLPGVRQLLEGLHGAGFRQAIGSSAPRENLELILDLTDCRRFFDVVVSAEDTQRGKPDPQVFLVAAKKLDVAPARCVVAEDAAAGVQAARAAGMKCVAVSYVGHHSDAALRAAGADLVVKTLEGVSVDTIGQMLSSR